MNYKTLFQVFLILLALFISGLFYLIYFDQEIKEDSSKQNLILDKTKSGLSEGNTIKEIFYESNDSNSNNYIIESDYGTFSDENKDEIIMVNVKAQINLKNGGNIYLMSDNAIYNSLNSDTKFFDNVDLEYLDHNVNADNIDVFFTDSKLEAYNNLIYRNSEVNLIADKVEVDLLTQDSKIFMFDNSKVKIIKD